jgi:hypothetical protein
MCGPFNKSGVVFMLGTIRKKNRAIKVDLLRQNNSLVRVNTDILIVLIITLKKNVQQHSYFR